MPNTHGPLVVALLYDGLCTFEFGIVAEIFGLKRPEMGKGWYRFASCAIEDGPLRAHGGFLLTPEYGSELIDEADVIVVPGWKGTDAPVPQPLIERLVRAHDRGARLASICSGAFVLAATGLLDGATATTHWRKRRWLVQRQARRLNLPARAQAAYAENLMSMSLQTYRTIAEEIVDFHVPPALGRSAIPTLVVAGGAETNIILQAVTQIASLMPHAEGRLAPGLGHGWNVEAPGLFSAMVRSWITDTPLPTELKLAP